MDIKNYENIIERESQRFSKSFFRGVEINSISVLRNRLDEKLYDFELDNYKIRFLNKLKDCITTDIKSSIQKKPKESDYIEGRENSLFIIEQKLKTIFEDYIPEQKEEDKFSDDELLDFNSTINQILDEVKLIQTGQEVIFNEIDELRDYLSLGKKTIRQLIYGKFKDIVVTKGIEISVVEPILKSLIAKLNDYGTNIIANM